MKDIDYNENIIKDLKLSELQVLNIVAEWYTNRNTPEIRCIFSDFELDLIAEILFWKKYEETKLIIESKSLLKK